MMRIRREYQLRKPLPTVMRKMFSGSGWTVLEKNGVVSSSSMTAISDATAASMASSTSVSFVMAI